MKKTFSTIAMIVIAILVILACILIPLFLGSSKNLLVQDLVAVFKGIPVMIGLVCLIGLIAWMWRYTLGKIIIIGLIVLGIIIGIILWWEAGERNFSCLFCVNLSNKWRFGYSYVLLIGENVDSWYYLKWYKRMIFFKER